MHVHMPHVPHARAHAACAACTCTCRTHLDGEMLAARIAHKSKCSLNTSPEACPDGGVPAWARARVEVGVRIGMVGWWGEGEGVG